MTFPKLLKEARVLADDGPALNATLKSLSMDPRFPAIVAWLIANREAFMEAADSQELVSNHAKVSHALGSAYAMRHCINQLRALHQPRAKGGMNRPEVDDG